MNILLAGGSGFIGTRLVEALLGRGDQVTVITRDPAGEQSRRRPGLAYRGWLPSLDGYDAVVNLSGTNLFGQRWDAAFKAQIRDSRIDTTRRLVNAIRAARVPPKVFVNGSAIGIYGDRGDEPLPEAAAPGDDFLARVCLAWETEALKCPVRTVLLRTGVVLGPGGGALQQMLPPFRFGLGGPIGFGGQHFSWIHIDDEVGLILHALDDDGLSGPLNAVAPGVVTNKQFTKALGRVLRRPTLFPVPTPALRLMLGEVAGLLTASQRCVPAVAEGRGYVFRHPEIEGALREILSPAGNGADAGGQAA